MLILLVLGSIILLLGMLFLIDKGVLKIMQGALNKPLFKSDEEFAYKHRILLGAILSVLGAVLLLLFLTLKK